MFVYNIHSWHGSIVYAHSNFEFFAYFHVVTPINTPGFQEMPAKNGKKNK